MSISITFILYITFLILTPLIANRTIDLGSSIAQTLEVFNTPFLAVFHLPSLVYIAGTFLVMQIFRQRINETHSVKKNRKQLKQVQSNISHIYKLLESDANSTEAYKILIQEQEKDVFFGRLLKLICNGCKESDIRLKLSVEFHQVIASAQEKIRYKGLMAGLMPMLGMIGTITGLMFIFSINATTTGGVEDSFNQKLSGMGTALLTTLYATLFTAIWFKPTQVSLITQLTTLQKELESLGHYCVLLINQIDINLLHHNLLTADTIPSVKANNNGPIDHTLKEASFNEELEE